MQRPGCRRRMRRDDGSQQSAAERAWNSPRRIADLFEGVLLQFRALLCAPDMAMAFSLLQPRHERCGRGSEQRGARPQAERNAASERGEELLPPNGRAGYGYQ